VAAAARRGRGGEAGVLEAEECREEVGEEEEEGVYSWRQLLGKRRMHRRGARERAN
jgi:hypothetical protein